MSPASETWKRRTIDGISIQKVFFQPDVSLDLAISQIVAGTNSIRALMPPGIQPPIVVPYNASSVAALQIGLSSDTLNERQLYDYGIYRLRQQLAPINGLRCQRLLVASTGRSWSTSIR